MSSLRSLTSRHPPVVVGIGGTTRSDSSSERALRLCLERVKALGGETIVFTATDLMLPHYAADRPERSAQALRLVDALRGASGVILSSPGYHGGISGLVKNALDYSEDLRDDERPYLEGRAVGCIACASGWQATATTLVALRSVVHALRGWPTPLGVALNSADGLWGARGELTNQAANDQLGLLAQQVVDFARRNEAV